MRVVKVGGEALFFAWAFEQEGAVSGHRFPEQDVLVPWHQRLKRKADSKELTSKKNSKGERNDDQVKQPETCEEGLVEGEDTQSNQDDKDRESDSKASHGVLNEEKLAVVYQRYCHVYSKGELPTLFQPLAPWVEVVSEHYDTGNWVVIARKTAEAPVDYTSQLCTV